METRPRIARDYSTRVSLAWGDLLGIVSHCPGWEALTATVSSRRMSATIPSLVISILQLVNQGYGYFRTKLAARIRLLAPRRRISATREVRGPCRRAISRRA
eukprot:1950744-Pyramimonas_sp.AAC.1